MLDLWAGYAMKLQAHLPGVHMATRDWRPPMIALVSLLGASILLLLLQSSVLLDNPLVERLDTSSVTHAHIKFVNAPHRVSLIVHSPDQAASPWSGYSVAHALPANVALSQRFSVGAEARGAFEVFGEKALRKVSANKRTERQPAPRHDRALIMLMFLRLHDDRRG